MTNTLSQRRSFARHGAAAINAQITQSIEELRAERVREFEKTKADYEAKHAAVPFTEGEYKAASLVRNQYGWHGVVRVNAKSVTVATGYSWTERIARDKVLEVRS